MLTQCLTDTSIKSVHCTALYWIRVIFCTCSCNCVHHKWITITPECCGPLSHSVGRKLFWKFQNKSECRSWWCFLIYCMSFLYFSWPKSVDTHVLWCRNKAMGRTGEATLAKSKRYQVQLYWHSSKIYNPIKIHKCSMQFKYAEMSRISQWLQVFIW